MAKVIDIRDGSKYDDSDDVVHCGGDPETYICQSCKNMSMRFWIDGVVTCFFCGELVAKTEIDYALGDYVDADGRN